MAGDAPGTAHENPDRPGDSPAPGPLALYRKYRPATFAEVKGQEHVTEPLRQALRSGRVHHAYLFSGPRGCGKTSSARILARSLNCEGGPTPDPCGACPSCVALAPSGPGSIDVIEIDAASHGGVDDARDLRERAFYAPVSGRFKIYIIDEAHMVTREGFNALLKLVEEPPPHLKFVFATTEPEKVIPTIRSRTHHYPFRLVPPATLRALLEEILSAEQVACEPTVVPLVVRAGAGSVRDSLSVLDQLLAGAGSEGLTYDRTVALLGYTDDRLLDEMVEAFAAGDGGAVFTAVERVVEGGHDARRFAADLLDRLRDLIILATVPGAGQTGLLDAPADRLDRMAEQATRIGQTGLTRAAEILSAALIQMRGATSPRLLLELACAQVLLPGAHTDEKALLARLERLERQLDGVEPGAARQAGPEAARQAGPGATRQAGPEATRQAGPEATRQAGPGAARQGGAGAAGVAGTGGPSAQSPRPPARERPGTGTGEAGGRQRAKDEASSRAASSAPPPEGGPVDADTLRQRWPQILDAVRAERKVAWILLRTATVHSLEGSVLTVTFPREGEARGFSSSGHDQVLTAVLDTLTGQHLQVRAVSGPPPAAAPRPDGPSPAPSPGSSAPGPAGPGQTGTANDATARPGPPPAGAGTAGRARSVPEQSPSPETFSQDDWREDAAASGGPSVPEVTGMDLIKRQLGGQIIEEIDDS